MCPFHSTDQRGSSTRQGAGFNFRFEDRDHHLRKIAVDLEPDRRIDVTFTDDERSHAVDCFIEYVTAHVDVE